MYFWYLLVHTNYVAPLMLFSVIINMSTYYCTSQANYNTLEQDCTTLKEDRAIALEESEARKLHEQILVQQLNVRNSLLVA